MADSSCTALTSVFKRPGESHGQAAAVFLTRRFVEARVRSRAAGIPTQTHDLETENSRSRGLADHSKWTHVNLCETRSYVHRLRRPRGCWGGQKVVNCSVSQVAVFGAVKAVLAAPNARRRRCGFLGRRGVVGG